MSKKNAPKGALHDQAGGLGSAVKKAYLLCDDDHITAFRNMIHAANLSLESASGQSQLAMLPKVLQHLGSSGLGTIQAEALGFRRIATRIKELKDVWDIITLRENVLSSDGLLHIGMARYVIIGKRKDVAPVQKELNQEVAE